MVNCIIKRCPFKLTLLLGRREEPFLLLLGHIYSLCVYNLYTKTFGWMLIIHPSTRRTVWRVDPQSRFTPLSVDKRRSRRRWRDRSTLGLSVLMRWGSQINKTSSKRPQLLPEALMEFIYHTHCFMGIDLRREKSDAASAVTFSSSPFTRLTWSASAAKTCGVHQWRKNPHPDNDRENVIALD